MSTIPIAVYDACVLYKSQLRNILIRIAATEIVNAKWTVEIQNEWLNKLLANRPDLNKTRLNNTCAKMNTYVLDCLVTNYIQHIEKVILPDKDDRHVLAAAIQANANFIITFNLRDFPNGVLAPYGITAIHPDTFLNSIAIGSTHLFCGLIKQLREDYIIPRVSAEKLLSSFEREGLRDTVATLTTMKHLL